MVDFKFVAFTAATAHFTVPALLAIMAAPFVSRWAWRSRHGLLRIAKALRRRFLSGNQQRAADQLPALELPTTANPEPKQEV